MKNDIVTLYIAYASGPGGKRRPALIVNDSGKNIICLPITSKYKSKSARIKKQYYPMQEWEKAGLNKQSYIDIGNQVTISKNTNVRIINIGKLQLKDIRGLNKFIKEYDINKGKL